MRRTQTWAYIGLLGIATALTYEFIVGFPRWFDGHLVYRHTDWYAYSRVLPIPYRHASAHYYYQLGSEMIRHGRFVNYYGNGQVLAIGQYRNGQSDGRWCNFSETGILEGEQIWRAGKQVGWSIYLGGELHYFREDLFVDDQKVGEQRFEGEWLVQHYVGFEHIQLPMRTVVTGRDLCPQ